MLHPSTLQLLRFPFSLLLMPVFWFAMSFVQQLDIARAAVAFFILHALVYPSSNGYNSYMDRDTDSIGGVANPLLPTKQLFIVSLWLDAAALALAAWVSVYFLAGIACYILFSRLYSYRGVRLKRFPVLGYLTVVANQGMLTFFLVYHAASKGLPLTFPFSGLLAAGFLIGGFYPITQIYQHRQDKADGVKTISMLLGIRGTFVFCGLMYAIAFVLLFAFYQSTDALAKFYLLQMFFVPVIFFFLRWVIAVWQNPAEASFKNTMRMNWIAAGCTNLAFFIFFIHNQLG